MVNRRLSSETTRKSESNVLQTHNIPTIPSLASLTELASSNPKSNSTWNWLLFLCPVNVLSERANVLKGWWFSREKINKRNNRCCLRSLEAWGAAAGVPLMRVPRGVYGWLVVLGAQRTVFFFNGAKRRTNTTQMEPKGSNRRKSWSKIMLWSVRSFRFFILFFI